MIMLLHGENGGGGGGAVMIGQNHISLLGLNVREKGVGVNWG